MIHVHYLDSQRLAIVPERKTPDIAKYTRVLDRWGYRKSIEHRAYVGHIDMFPNIVKDCAAQHLDIWASQDIIPALKERRQHIYDELIISNELLSNPNTPYYPFQKDGIQFLQAHTHAGLFDEMGLGKTVEALGALTSPAIVVCPASLKKTWEKECKRWRPNLKPLVIEGMHNFFGPRLGEIVILNYDILPQLEEWAHLVIEEDTTLIGDEIQALKNPIAKRSKRWDMLAERCAKVWGMTGTPLLNNPRELWCILETIGGLGTRAFVDFFNFSKDFHMARGQWGYQTRRNKPSEKAITKLTTVALRRNRKDVMPELPTKIYQVVVADAPEGEDLVLCDEVYSEYGVDIVQAIVDANNPEALMGIHKISAARQALAMVKLHAMMEQVKRYEEAGEPAVVFSAHKRPIEILGERKGWAHVVGSTTNKRRAAIVEDFQVKKKLIGMAATIKTMGLGHTLTRAHHALFVDCMWTPADNEQAEDRLCRIGQDTGVVITVLVADHPLDELVESALARKRQIFKHSITALGKRADKAIIDNRTRDLGRVIEMLQTS